MAFVTDFKTTPDTSHFSVTVNPVNDAPVLSDIDDQTIDEDGVLSLDLFASDVDGDVLTFSATNGDSEIVVDGSTLTITPPADYNGSDDVTVTVTDGELSDSTTFTLTVNPVNDAPVVISPIEDLEVDAIIGNNKLKSYYAQIPCLPGFTFDVNSTLG